MTSTDAAAFCDEIRGRLVGSLYLYCGDRPLAEELAQEALARTWERWDQVSAMASPEAWTFATARNLARSRFRRRAVERRARRRLAAERPAAEPDSADSVAVRAAVQSLPERQRATIVARFYLGLDVAATAELLGCATGTVKAATSQAIDRLRSSGLIDDEVDEHEDVEA